MEKSLREKLKKEMSVVATVTEQPRPEGAFTRAEFAEEMGISEWAAERRLRLLTKNGVLRQVRFSVVDPDGRKNVRGGYVLVPEGERPTPAGSGAHGKAQSGA